MKRVPSIYYIQDVYRNCDSVYSTGNFMDSCIVFLTLPQDIFGTSHEQTRLGREKGVCNWSWPLTGM